MPEKLEEAMYEGLEQEQQARRRAASPDPTRRLPGASSRAHFPTSSRPAPPENVKASHQPANASEMWELWTMEVHSRLIPADEEGIAF